MQKAEGGLGRSSLSQIASANQKHKYFTQEIFPGCDTYLAPQLVVTIFIFVGIIFIPLGIAVLVASKSVVEIYDRYDTACLPEYLINDAQRAQYIWDNRSKKICTRTLRVPKLMRKPIYVYYQLENFYQNHRRFITSRSDEQLLQGIYAYPKKLHNCEPLRTYENRTIIPCGLVAWSLFNDTYKLMINDQELDINKKEIAWESDRKERFGRSVHPENFLNNIGYGSSTGGAALSLNKPVPITVLQCNWQPVSDERHYKFLLKVVKTPKGHFSLEEFKKLGTPLLESNTFFFSLFSSLRRARKQLSFSQMATFRRNP